MICKQMVIDYIKFGKSVICLEEALGMRYITSKIYASTKVCCYIRADCPSNNIFHQKGIDLELNPLCYTTRGIWICSGLYNLRRIPLQYYQRKCKYWKIWKYCCPATQTIFRQRTHSIC